MGIVILAYVSFLFILPNALNIDDFKPEITKLVKEQTKLTLDFKNAKIIIKISKI